MRRQQVRGHVSIYVEAPMPTTMSTVPLRTRGHEDQPFGVCPKCFFVYVLHPIPPCTFHFP